MDTPDSKLLTFRKVFIACLLAYVICVSFRFMELPAWNSPSLQIDGEPLMATHDAYAWMAGAKETGRWTGAPMSQVLAALHAVTGLSLGTINFWLPVLLAPLVVVPICIVLARWGYVDFASLAGILGGGSFGFLLRTRAGYGDTDVLSLLLPLVFGTALVLWSHRLLRPDWLRKSPAPEREVTPRPFFLQAALVGISGWAFMWFYPNAFPIALAMLACFGATALWLSPPIHRPWLHFGLGLILFLSLMGTAGLVLGLAVTGFALVRPWLATNKKLALILLLLALVLTPFLGVQKPQGIIKKLTAYGEREAVVTEQLEPSLPGVVQSIREAQQVDWDGMARRNAVNWYVFIPALLGSMWLFYRRPASLTFLPLLGISLAAFALGNRFSMFGGAVLGMGLAAVGSDLLRRLGLSETMRWLIQIGLCLLLAWPIWDYTKHLRARPVLPRIYAQSLKDMREIAPVDAQLWQWWDYGYAAQYYAERKSFGDGGEHAGPHLYPLGVVHATNSPLQASQMIKFVASSQQEQLRELQAAGNLTDPQHPVYFPNNPVKPLMEMSPTQAKEFVASLGQTQREWSSAPPEQYLVLSWENLKLGAWITYFGNWDVATGESKHGTITRIAGKINLDSQRGVLDYQGRQIPIGTLDVISEEGMRRQQWPPREVQYHLIANNLSREVYLMDSQVYQSMMISMLLQDTTQFTDHFELVLDRSPWVRAYRVR